MIASAEDDSRKRARLRELLEKRARSQGGAGEKSFPLSAGQRALAYLHRLAPRSWAYHVALCVRCREPLESERLVAALRSLLQRHESLRCRLHQEARKPPSQRVGPAAPVAFLDGESLGEEQVEEIVRRSLETPFDLSKEPPARWTVIRRAPEDHIVCWIFHHIAVDFWSLGLLLEEMDALLRGDALLPVGAPYDRFVDRQEKLLGGPEGDRLRRYWKERLTPPPAPLELPLDRPRPAEQAFRGATVPLRFAAGEALAAKDLAREAGATLFSTLLAVLQILLRRWTGQRDLAVATPVAHREAAFETTVGYFVHQVAIRGDRGLDARFSEVVEQVRDRSLEAVEHCDLPFAELVNLLDLPRDPSRAPLCDVGFALETSRMDRRGIFPLLLGEPGSTMELGGKRWEAVDLPQQEGQLDLNLHLLEGQGTLGGLVAYDTALFDETTIQRFLDQYRLLLGAIAAEPGRPVGDLSLLSPAEEEQLVALGSSPAPASVEGSLLEDVLRRCRRQPGAVAVEGPGGALTYGELEERSAGLAHRLRALGVGPEVPVAVLEEPSAELVVAWLAVFRAGGAYLPLDPQNPPGRIREMLGLEPPAASAGMARRALVSREQILEETFGAGALREDPQTGEKVLGDAPQAMPVLLQDDPRLQESPADFEEPPRAFPQQLANIIFTSGSTGRPKGVMVAHGGLYNVVRWNRRLLELGPEDRVANTLRPGFDPAALEIWGTLTAGAALVIPGAEDRISGRRFGRWLASRKITVVTTPAPLGESLLAAGLEEGSVLRVLVLGGEALKRRPGRDLGITVHNHYGPTETTIVASGGEVEPAGLSEERPTQGPPHVGRPVDGVGIELSDGRLRTSLPGTVGEVCIRGAGVSRGYLGQAGRTAEVFVPDPSSSAPGGRIYRTGDLGRWGADGNLHLQGRRDRQVKIRGHRIELEEIERRIQHLPAVSAGAVKVLAPSTTAARLVAYVVPRDSRKPPEAKGLLSALEEHLPAYMVPSQVVFLEGLPLTANGKVDRSCLPAPEISKEAEDLPVRGELEETIAEVWRRVLGRREMPPAANFFDLGGNSLLLGEALGLLEDALDRSLTLVELLRFPTVRSLAAHLGAFGAEEVQGPPAQEAPEPPTAYEPGEPIAVIGMAGRFPGAESIGALWELLRQGREGLRALSPEETAEAGASDEAVRDPRFVAVGGVLDGVEDFDAGFFGLNPREAEILDPQQRIFLECAWQALEDAGYVPTEGDRTGVFAGAGKSGYLSRHLEGHEELVRSVGEYQLSIANEKDFLATRVSYRLNLKGPAVNVQTACSTSLVAVHLACQSLRAGECEMALAGGVTVRLPQTSGYRYEEGMILSEDGQCSPFSDAATGTVGGNGAGVVLLKPLARALADGDPVRGVLRGSAINNDGSLKAGFTAPTVDGQAAVIRRALAVSGIAPDEISYVEAHGTATQLGDPIEVEALNLAFRGASKPVFLGSVKSNLGHLDAAAGVTGLIKTLLALEHQELPPTLHYERPNPRIDFEGGPFEVVGRRRPWLRGETPRRAGVSSFGIGGTNAHVIVEEAPRKALEGLEELPAGREKELWLLSGASLKALEEQQRRLAEFLESASKEDLEDEPRISAEQIAFTLQTGRKSFEHRGAWVLGRGEDGARVLGDPSRGRRGRAGDAGAVVQLFPGQGAQHPGMGRELYDSFPVFRRHVDRCSEVLESHLGFDLRSWLYRPLGDRAAAERLRETDLAQPALFVISSALARLWDSLGISASAMIGHSIGEWVAAYRAGVLELEEALALVAARGRLIRALPPGSMISVPLAQEDLLAWTGDEVSLAAVNSPKQGVLSGSQEAIAEVEKQLQQQGIEVRRLHTSHAFHSPMMEPCLGAFREEVRRVELRPPQRAFVSNVTGTWIRPEEATDAEYWVRQLRSTVRFSDALSTLADEYGSPTFLECGPGRALSTFARGAFPGARALASLPHAKSDTGSLETFLEAAGDLWLAGQEMKWEALYDSPPRRCSLPGAAFQRERFWIDPPKAAARGDRSHPAAAREPAAGVSLYRPFWRTAVPARLLPRRAEEKWLFVGPREGLGKLPKNALEALEARGAEVTLAFPGRQLRQLSPQEFEVGAGEAPSFLDLLQSLRRDVPERIVYFLPSPGSHEASGFFDLLSWIRAFQAKELAGRLSGLDVVIPEAGSEDSFPGAAGGIGPGAAQVEALVATLAVEVPAISCRTIRWRGGAGAPGLLEELLGEDSARQVLYAGGQRFVSGWEALPAADEKSLPPVLETGGAYLITGGLGGMGLELAERLALEVKARLILVSRRLFPETAEAFPEESSDLAEARRRIESWRQGGAEVMTATADVTDPMALAAVVGQARKRFQRIHGVIHCAGVAGGGLLETRDPEACRRVLAPKVTGTDVLTAVLREILADDPPDFFVLSSSLASVLAMPGQADYAAANAYLDAFAESSPLPGTVAIQWDYWNGVGMAAGELPAGFEDLRRGPGLTPQEGWKAFRGALASGLRRVAVAAFDLPRALAEGSPAGVYQNSRSPEGRGREKAREEPFDEPSGAVGEAHQRPELPTVYAAPRVEAEQRLARIWSGLLGIEPIGIHDDFFELGGHSLLGTRLLGRVEDAFGIRLPLAKLFQLPTVAALAAELERLGPAPRAERPLPEPPEAPLQDPVQTAPAEAPSPAGAAQIGASEGLDLDPDQLSDEAVAELLASLAPLEVEA